jgi:hypothetical protein
MKKKKKKNMKIKNSGYYGEEIIKNVKKMKDKIKN